MLRAALVVGSLLAVAAASRAAEPRPLLLVKAPTARYDTAVRLAAGEHRFADGPAVLHVPDGPGPFDLLVALPGYLQAYERYGRTVAKVALPRGIAVLVVNYRGRTWDVLERATATADLAHVDSAIAWALAQLPVVRERVALMGVSDGATYALPLGISNPAVFHSVVAVVPGGIGAPVARHARAPEILLLVGSHDHTFPAPLYADKIRDYLTRNGIAFEHRVFTGDHGFPRGEVPGILDWAFRR